MQSIKIKQNQIIENKAKINYLNFRNYIAFIIYIYYIYIYIYIDIFLFNF